MKSASPHASPLTSYALLCLLLLVAFGCKTSSPVTESQRLADAWVTALSSHQADQIAALTQPDATYEDPTTDGARSLRAFINGMWAQAPDVTFAPKTVVGQGRERIAIEWHSTRTLGNGQVFPLDGVFVIDLRDQHATHVRCYYDPGKILAFLPLKGPG